MDDINIYDEMPSSFEAEQGVLGAIFVNNDAYWIVAPLIDAEHFYEPVHQDIYRAAGELISSGRRADPVVMAPSFKDHEGLKGLGGNTYLAHLTATATGVSIASEYAITIKDMWLRRTMIGIGREISAKAADQSTLDIQIVADQAEAEIHAALNAKQTDSAMTAGKAAGIVLDRAEEAFEKGVPIGLSTGLKGVDALIGHMMPGDMIVLGGATSMGKTALAQQIAINIAIAGKRADVVSLEMSAPEYTARHMAQWSEVPANRIEQGRFTEAEYARLSGAKHWIEGLPLWIDATPKLKVSQIRSRARRQQRLVGLDFIMIDHLQFVRYENSRSNRIEGTEQITQDIKAMAKELEVPVLLISHLNRDLWKRPDKRPIMSDLYGAGAIEKDADIVFFIHREEYYLDRDKPTEGTSEFMEWRDNMDKAKDKAEIILAKRRRGRGSGRETLGFNAKLTVFSDIQEEVQEVLF